MFSAGNATPSPAARGGVRAQPSEEAVSDKRRWMSFLTWAFVLAEIAGRDALLPAAAHAGDEAVGNVPHAGADTAPIANHLPDVNVATATESPDPITYQHAATMPEYVAAPLASELAEAKTVPVAELGPELSAGGHGGGGGGVADAGAGGEGQVHLGLAQPLAALGQDGGLLDLGLHLDLGDLLHDVLGTATDGLGGLPLVGGLLHGVGDAVGGTLGNVSSALEPVVSLVGIGHDDASGYGSDLGLPGQLLFGPSEGASGPSELVSPVGNYTTYGIALSIGGSAGSSSADAALNADASDGIGLDMPAIDHLSGADLHVGSDALHLDQAILRTAADTLA
jgi:hypothetical protein